MGKPVVMTSFAKLPEFDSIVKTADSPEEFRNAIRSSIQNDDKENRAQRIQVAQKNSWEERSIELNDILESVNGEKV